mgnify:CR=1 FL=1
MKVLITPQFNTAMKSLNSKSQQEVSTLYSFVSLADKEDIISSAFTKITSKNDDIFTLRGSTVRVFCTFSSQDSDEEVLVLLDVNTVLDAGLKLSSAELKGEITLFGALGEPVAYIEDDNEKTIFSFNGEPLAYINENNIYGFNGIHLGWFEDQIIWDHLGQQVGFTKNTCPRFTQFEPFKGFKQFKPFRAFKQFAPLKPLKSSTVSSIRLLEFLRSGRN